MAEQINIKRIRDRFYIIYNYIIETQGSNFFFEECKRKIDIAYEQSDQRSLKRADKEIDVWLVEMFPPKEKLEVSKLLKGKLNEDTNKADINRIRNIDRILKRGRINTLKEFSLVQQRVEEIYDDYTKKLEVEKLNKLLANFHK